RRWLWLAAALFALGCLNELVFIALDPLAYLAAVQSSQQDHGLACLSSRLVCYQQNLTFLALSLLRLPIAVGWDTLDAGEVLREPLVWLYAAALGAGIAITARRGQVLALCLLGAAALLLPLAQPASYAFIPDGRYAMPVLPPLYTALAAALSRPPGRVPAVLGPLAGRCWRWARWAACQRITPAMPTSWWRSRSSGSRSARSTIRRRRAPRCCSTSAWSAGSTPMAWHAIRLSCWRRWTWTPATPRSPRSRYPVRTRCSCSPAQPMSGCAIRLDWSRSGPGRRIAAGASRRHGRAAPRSACRQEPRERGNPNHLGRCSSQCHAGALTSCITRAPLRHPDGGWTRGDISLPRRPPGLLALCPGSERRADLPGAGRLRSSHTAFSHEPAGRAHHGAPADPGAKPRHPARGHERPEGLRGAVQGQRGRGAGHRHQSRRADDPGPARAAWRGRHPGWPQGVRQQRRRFHSERH